MAWALYPAAKLTKPESGVKCSTRHGCGASTGRIETASANRRPTAAGSIVGPHR